MWPDPGLIQCFWDFVFSQHACISPFFPLQCGLPRDALHISLQQTQPVAFSIGIRINGPSLIFIDHHESIYLHPIYSNSLLKALPSLCLGHVPISEARSWGQLTCQGVWCPKGKLPKLSDVCSKEKERGRNAKR